MKNGVIVLGGHVQALGIVRIFGREKIPVVIIDKTKKNLAKHSCYCVSFIHVQDKDLLDFLINTGIMGRFHDWQIYPTNDLHVSLLSKNKEVLSKYYKVAVDDWQIIESFYNKKVAYRKVSGLNIPIPVTWYPENETDIKNFDGIFPCIIKPAVMHSFYSVTKKKVFKCIDKNELLKYYRIVSGIIPIEEIMVQEIVPGNSDNQYSACFFSVRGNPIVSLSACRLRQHPLDFGNATTYAETMENPDILEYGRKILESSRYTGLCEIEFKKDIRDNRYKFLEVNTRTWKWHIIGILSGSPFLTSYYIYLNGEAPEAQTIFNKASFCHPLTDTYVRLLMLLKGIPLWKRNLQPQIKAVWDDKDIKPWVYEKLYIFNFLHTR